MTKIDFSKGINFKPLVKLGIDKAKATKLLIAMSPFIDLEFKGRVRSVFNKQELAQIGEEAKGKGIKPEDGASFLEEKYFQKTGRYFMEEMRLVYNQYVNHVADMIKRVREDIIKFKGVDKKKQQELERLIKEDKYEKAAKLIDEILKKEKS